MGGARWPAAAAERVLLRELRELFERFERREISVVAEIAGRTMVRRFVPTPGAPPWIEVPREGRTRINDAFGHSKQSRFGRSPSA
jgi:hypothetical protein